jgi:hypothetical protein
MLEKTEEEVLLEANWSWAHTIITKREVQRL